jgi:hypothetical protein
MLELGELGVCDWRIDMLEPLGAEFLCLLRRGVKRVADATRLQQRRMALLYQGLSETGEQIRLALSDAKQNSTAKPIPQWGALPLLYGMP